MPSKDVVVGVSLRAVPEPAEGVRSASVAPPLRCGATRPSRQLTQKPPLSAALSGC
jgi:hypothetical protein